jgi:hypothetical protein
MDADSLPDICQLSLAAGQNPAILSNPGVQDAFGFFIIVEPDTLNAQGDVMSAETVRSDWLITTC